VVPGQIGHERPFPEAAMYRAEIEGLYLCGAGMHPMGGISACVGYNVYKVLSDDFGLAYKPWEKSDRGY
jgi:phytoene dehydrogenase-like protein